jgi:hypothetical protein
LIKCLEDVEQFEFGLISSIVYLCLLVAFVVVEQHLFRIHPTSSGFLPCNMYDPKTFTLEVTAEELVLIETALLGSARAQEYNDALFSLLQRVHSLRPLPFAASPMPSSSICAGSTSLSQSLTRFLPESPGSSSHTTLASLGLPLDVAADQTSAEEENSDEEDQLMYQ